MFGPNGGKLVLVEMRKAFTLSAVEPRRALTLSPLVVDGRAIDLETLSMFPSFYSMLMDFVGNFKLLRILNIFAFLADLIGDPSTFFERILGVIDGWQLSTF